MPYTMYNILYNACSKTKMFTPFPSSSSLPPDNISQSPNPLSFKTFIFVDWLKVQSTKSYIKVDKFCLLG